MVKSVLPQSLILKIIVLSAHTGMASTVQVIQIPVLKELSGLEISVKQLIKNAKRAHTGLAPLALLFHPNAQLSSPGMINKKDVSHQTTYAQAEHISTGTYACLTAHARTVRFGATVWSNVFALTIHFGTEQAVFNAWAV